MFSWIIYLTKRTNKQWNELKAFASKIKMETRCQDKLQVKHEVKTWCQGWETFSLGIISQPREMKSTRNHSLSQCWVNLSQSSQARKYLDNCVFHTFVRFLPVNMITAIEKISIILVKRINPISVSSSRQTGSYLKFQSTRSTGKTKIIFLVGFKWNILHVGVIQLDKSL